MTSAPSAGALLRWKKHDYFLLVQLFASENLVETKLLRGRNNWTRPFSNAIKVGRRPKVTIVGAYTKQAPLQWCCPSASNTYDVGRAEMALGWDRMSLMDIRFGIWQWVVKNSVSCELNPLFDAPATPSVSQASIVPLLSINGWVEIYIVVSSRQIS